MATQRDVVVTSIRLPRTLADAAKAAAKQVLMSRNAFIVSALAQRVKNWKSPTTGEGVRALDSWPSGFPKGAVCPICFVRPAPHDPAEAHPENTIDEADFARALEDIAKHAR